jgi:hypothetical protein
MILAATPASFALPEQLARQAAEAVRELLNLELSRR